ncbi:hypothetical protein C7M84_020603 [Penaeus vannamei]|uniref:Uncharacterized protein n=1 Tax=Penaeus vannamei TaxID=6689 RepID=A0A3R7MH16_PENVA|nr:hypothetical protein C7M84_020603 [Penaeus vannamei]
MDGLVWVNLWFWVFFFSPFLFLLLSPSLCLSFPHAHPLASPSPRHPLASPSHAHTHPMPLHPTPIPSLSFPTPIPWPLLPHAIPWRLFPTPTPGVFSPRHPLSHAIPWFLLPDPRLSALFPTNTFPTPILPCLSPHAQLPSSPHSSLSSPPIFPSSPTPTLYLFHAHPPPFLALTPILFSSQNQILSSQHPSSFFPPPRPPSLFPVPTPIPLPAPMPILPLPAPHHPLLPPPRPPSLFPPPRPPSSPRPPSLFPAPTPTLLFPPHAHPPLPRPRPRPSPPRSIDRIPEVKTQIQIQTNECKCGVPRVPRGASSICFWPRELRSPCSASFPAGQTPLANNSRAGGGRLTARSRVAIERKGDLSNSLHGPHLHHRQQIIPHVPYDFLQLPHPECEAFPPTPFLLPGIHHSRRENESP